ncbi:RNA methyltransferase [Grimontia marina]|uniref:SpoU rRNA Methylase family protein n=1 Tax=Grimontia marina TaxID=646534 RepID=A0A128FHN4_9GAMM|nr:RNA methyltransferase [Grimontia marina]CZF85814.1 SpoU rRNA Methylase family protein [Grimontia marina]
MTETHVIIGLINPKSPTNVGGVMRAAGCYQADSVVYTGERYDRAARFYTDTQDAMESIPLTNVDSMFDNLPSDMKVVCVELALGATPLPEFEHPEKAIYVFGPEDHSLHQSIADRADHVVYVPTVGCMNLAATVNVVLYDRLAKSGTTVAGDDLIRQSRDSRNRLQVKSSAETV